MSTFTDAFSEVEKEFQREFPPYHLCSGCEKVFILGTEFCEKCKAMHASLKAAKKFDPVCLAVWSGIALMVMFELWCIWRWL